MEKVKLGELLNGTEERDAIHIAIAPVVAGRYLSPGDHVGLDEKGEATKDCDPIGIVDPFLGDRVKKGERFYLCLYPNTVTSLRHHWRHFSFPETDKVDATKEQAAKDWLKWYAATIARPYDREFGEDVAYAKFMAEALRGEIYYYGNDCHSSAEVEHADQLFENLSIVFGRRVGPGDFEYSCGC